MTAEEFLFSQGYTEEEIMIMRYDGTLQIMTEFAKYHVQEALEKASKTNLFRVWMDENETYYDAYPLENIK